MTKRYGINTSLLLIALHPMNAYAENYANYFNSGGNNSSFTSLSAESLWVIPIILFFIIKAFKK